MQNVELDNKDTIKNIKIESTNETWSIIGGKKKWIRKCPTCNKDLLYNSRNSRNRSRRNKSKCKNCEKIFRRKYNIDKLERICFNCKCKITYTGKQALYHYVKAEKEKRICRSCSKKGQINGMYGTNRTGILHPSYGRRHSDEEKRKMRIAACKRILKLQRNNTDGRINNVGIKEGNYFDTIEKENGWDGIYHKKSNKQFLIENLGYFVDYYEPNKNIVIEYDEPYHNTIKQKNKDKIRQIQIINHLKCKFYRYNERKNILKKYE